MGIGHDSKLSQMRKRPTGDEAEFGETSPLRRRALLELIGYLIAGSIPMLLLAFLLVGFQPLELSLATAFYFVGSLLIIRLLRRGFTLNSLGAGNLITLIRFVAVSALFSAIFVSANPWLIVVISVLAMVLDGFDGFFARKTGAVSEFGARLDMEVDSALAVVLALNIWLSGIASPLIVLLALPRYLFAAASYLFSWLNKPLPERYSRKVVSVIQVATLVGLNAPIIPSWFVLPVSLIVAASLIWSFGKDVIWLRRSR